MNFARRFFGLFLTLSLLAGCGFHLRDYYALPTALQPIYIGGDAGSGVFASNIRQLLQSEEIDLVPAPAAARYLLLLTDEEQERRIVSLDRRGRIAEIGLIAAVSFELVDREGRTVLSQRVEERRTIVNNPDNVISTNEEENLSRGEMGRTLAANVLRRLSAYQPGVTEPDTPADHGEAPAP